MVDLTRLGFAMAVAILVLTVQGQQVVSYVGSMHIGNGITLISELAGIR